MVIPDRDPRELLMAQQKVKVCSVTGVSRAVVVKGENRAIWQGDSANAPPVAVVIALVLVYVVTNMQDIVDRVFSGRIAKCVEIAEREVAA